MKNLLITFIMSLSSLSFAATQVNGAGSTFAEPLYTKWFSQYSKSHTEAGFNYQGIGSGGGIRQLIAGTVDFAGSDAPLNAEETQQMKSKVLHVPVALGAVVVTYNLDVKTALNLSGDVVADIFLGKITKWNDARIAALNKGTALPDKAIIVATRSDGSGTTAVFTEYLAKVSKDWTGKDGKQVKWFAGSVGGKGNAGVAGLVKQTPGAIGYVELVYALENKMSMAAIQNKAGKFVTADLKTVTAAASKIEKDMIQNEYKLSITNSAVADAYPISSFTWMLIPNEMPKEKGAAIVAFAKWAVSDEAQKAATQINYAAVPSAIGKAVMKDLAKIQLH